MNAINDLDNWRTEMNLNAIYPHPDDLREASAESISTTVGAVFACMRNGMRVARRARRLYAMNDETLRHDEGLTREEISAHLASLL